MLIGMMVGKYCYDDDIFVVMIDDDGCGSVSYTHLTLPTKRIV